jgi:PIN domain nuclease of toxin-antitoxin system
MKTDADRPVLLDTHFWIWQQFGVMQDSLSTTWKAIEAAASSGTLLLSVISVWEVGLLDSKGRLELFTPCEQWVHEALATPGLTLVPLTPEIAVHSTRLPGNFHSDPADRIIAATARIMGARLATRDRKLIDYAKQHHITVCQ